MNRTLLKIVLIALLVLGFVGTEIYMFRSSPSTDQVEEKIIYVRPNSSLKEICKALQDEKIISNATYFNLYVRWKGASTKIKSGELRFYTNAKPKEVLNILIKGHPVLYPVTVPEGFNIYQVADRLSEAQLVDKKKFLDVCADKEFIENLKITGSSVEGYLFPDTYAFSKYLGEKLIIKRMVDRFHEVFTPELEKKAKQLQLSKKEVIVLASIVEKETGAAFERPLIASVFHNRLKKGMKIQSDPTVIYGMWERYSGNLTKTDLQERTPYNTYTIYGLPVGPIANPGRDSIKAVLFPAKTDYLYFVAKNDESGTHIFSKNLKEHNAAVNKHQKGL